MDGPAVGPRAPPDLERRLDGDVTPRRRPVDHDARLADRFPARRPLPDRPEDREQDAAPRRRREGDALHPRRVPQHESARLAPDHEGERPRRGPRVELELRGQHALARREALPQHGAPAQARLGLRFGQGAHVAHRRGHLEEVVADAGQRQALPDADTHDPAVGCEVDEDLLLVRDLHSGRHPGRQERDSGGQREARVERRRRGRQQRARGPRGERGAGGGERGGGERDEGAAHRTWLIAGSVDESGSSSTGAKVMSSKRAK